MSVKIDPRLVERRRAVQEDGARSHLNKLLIVMIVAALTAGVWWLLRSPLMDVDRITLVGAVNSHAESIVFDAGVYPGSPIASISSDAVEEKLLADPWVLEARVVVTFPGTVQIAVIERIPAAWLQTSRGWFLIAADGQRLKPGSPDDQLPRLYLRGASSRDVEAGLEFVHQLRGGLGSGVEVSMGGEGQLTAIVDGFTVRLGQATDMRIKAIAVEAVLAEGQLQGSEIDVSAPTHPSVLPPEPQGKDEGTDSG